jgi:ParB family chromosome partitioning protein
MAAVKESMRSFVAGSLMDRPEKVVHGETGGPPARSALERQTTGRKRLDAACEIRLERITRDPNQPREHFDPDELERLAGSIRARGVLQPIRVRWDEAADRYVIVVGERRYRAAVLAGLESVPCIVAGGNPTPEDLLEDQLVENALRSDLRPVEQARAYKTLLTARGLSQRQLADRLHVSHATIARTLALLELPEDLQGRVDAGELAPSVAYEVSRLEDPGTQRAIIAEVVAEGLNRDEAVAKVRRRSGRGKGRGAKAGPVRLRLPDAGLVVIVGRTKGKARPLSLLDVRSALRDALASLPAEADAAA